VRRLSLTLTIAALLAAGFYAYANPERAALDATARAAAPGSFITLRDGQTHYEIAGPDTGRVAVLVHGFSVPAYIWDSTFNALAAAGYRVLRYDLFGRGWSDRPDASYDAAFYDAQLGQLMDSLRITGPVDLFGLSFGGAIAAHFAAAHPTRVRSLVLVDPLTAAREAPGVVGAPFIGAYFWQVAAVPRMADGQTTDFLHPERFPGWADKYRPQTRYRGFGRSLRRSLLARGSVDFPTIYARIASAGTPVLLVWGKQDATLPISDAENVTRAIPATEFFAVDSAGHLPHLEQAAAFNARLLEFLARNAAKP
jgi:pimeloyl-ACP methyl ester carboxylesterase